MVYSAARTCASSGALLGLERRQLARRQRHVQLVGDAALVADVHDAQRFAQYGDRLVQYRGAHLQSAQVDVSTRHVGDDRQQHHVARCDRRLGVVARRFDLAPVLAEDIELPDRIEAADLLMCFSPWSLSADTRVCEARPRARSLPVPWPAPARRLATGSTVPMIAASKVRAACSRSSATEDRVADDGARHQGVELRILERVPPCGHSIGRGDWRPWRVLPGRSWRRRCPWSGGVVVFRVGVAACGQFGPSTAQPATPAAASSIVHVRTEPIASARYCRAAATGFAAPSLGCAPAPAHRRRSGR